MRPKVAPYCIDEFEKQLVVGGDAGSKTLEDTQMQGVVVLICPLNSDPTGRGATREGTSGIVLRKEGEAGCNVLVIENREIRSIHEGSQQQLEDNFLLTVGTDIEGRKGMGIRPSQVCYQPHRIRNDRQRAVKEGVLVPGCIVV